MNIGAGLLAAAMTFLSLAASAADSVVPPESYENSSFVDRRGCEYGRVVVGGWEIWVQRLDEKRQPVCGQEPTRFRKRETTERPQGRT